MNRRRFMRRGICIAGTALVAPSALVASARATDAQDSLGPDDRAFTPRRALVYAALLNSVSNNIGDAMSRAATNAAVDQFRAWHAAQPPISQRTVAIVLDELNAALEPQGFAAATDNDRIDLLRAWCVDRVTGPSRLPTRKQTPNGLYCSDIGQLACDFASLPIGNTNGFIRIK
jgi:hypothetical protein